MAKTPQNADKTIKKQLETTVGQEPYIQEQETSVGQVSDKPSQVIEVISPSIQIDLPEAESFKTSIRINKAVWDAFGSFAEQHKEFNKSDLIAQALKEFMDKH